MSFEEIPTTESFNNEPEIRPIHEIQTIDNEDDIKNAVLKMQELFIKSAEQYLDKESDKYLKEQIIKFYSDENRLKTELTNVFSDMGSDDISKKIEEESKSIENKDDFIKYVETKNFATSQEERVVEEERIQNIHKIRDEESLDVVRNEISKINSQTSQKPENAKAEKLISEEDVKKFELNFKGIVENISSDSKVMLNALYERQQERLTPIQTNENFQIMASIIKNLSNFDEKINKKSISEFSDNINKLSHLFSDIRIYDTSSIRESRQNLEKLAYGSRNFSSSCEEYKNRLPIDMSDKDIETANKELRRGLQKLSEQTQNLFIFASKLRERAF